MYDNIGTVRGLTDASGAVTDTYELDTFGRQVSSTGSTPNPCRFGGAWGYITDPSGMLQLGMRHYWPEVGAFVQRDPARSELYPYAYTRSNPVVATDPDGLRTYDRRRIGDLCGLTTCWDDCRSDFHVATRVCIVTSAIIATACGVDFAVCMAESALVGYPACRRKFAICSAIALATQAACEAFAIAEYNTCMDRCVRDHAGG